MTDRDLKDLLDTEAARINSPSFIGDDPVQFPRRFSDLRDIEIASLAHIGHRLGQPQDDMPRLRQIAGHDGQQPIPVHDGQGL